MLDLDWFPVPVYLNAFIICGHDVWPTFSYLCCLVTRSYYASLVQCITYNYTGYVWSVGTGCTFFIYFRTLLKVDSLR